MMASVPEREVNAFRLDLTLVVHPSLVSGASHFLVDYVKVQPLGLLLNDAIDGGELLHEKLWHPLRPPYFHRPPAVCALADQVEAAWETARADLPNDDGGWLVAEVTRLLRLYRHAGNVGECVVTALDMPADQERAKRVRIPWLPIGGLHGRA
jgi:hypothetical protein